MDKDKHSISGPLSSLSSILIKSGLGLLPGGGVAVGVYELLHLSAEQLAAYMERKAEERCREFHSRLTAGGTINEAIARNLDVTDYQALLAACLNEMEVEKAGLYGEMASSIGLGKVDPRHKRFMILALRDLSYAQLALAKHAYIAKHHELKPSQGGGDLHPGDCLKIGSSDEIDEVNFESLLQVKIVKERNLTSLGEKFITCCFKPDELTPQSIGAAVWHTVHLEILSYELNGMVNTLAMSLSTMAWEKNMKSSIRMPKGQKRLSARPRFYILIADSEFDILHQNRDALTLEIGPRPLLIVHLSPLPEGTRELFPNASWLNGENKSIDEVVTEVMSSLLPE
jgi:hypothetical protein